MQMHISILLWGFTGIFGKAIEMNEVMIVWYRMILSAAALMVIIFFMKHRLFINKKSLVPVCLTGILVTLHWISFYASIKYSNVSIALACFSSVSLFSALLEPLILKTKFNPSNILLALMVIAGIYIIFSFQHWYAKGIVLSLISAFLGAWFTILNKKFVANDSPQAVTLIELISGFVFLSVILFPVLNYFNYSFEIPATNNYDWLWLVLLSVVCTSVAFTLSLESLKKISAFTMNLSVNLEPLYSIVLAMIFFREQKVLNAGFYAGALLVISSVVIHTLFQYRNSKA